MKAVHDDDLPMIAKVDLKTIGAAADGVKRAHLDPAVAHPFEAAPRRMAADVIVKKIDAHSGADALEKALLKLTSDLVVAKNVELHQHVIACRFDSGEDRGERRLAVDQQLRVVSRSERKFGQALEGQFPRMIGSHQQPSVDELLIRLLRDRTRFRQSAAALDDVADELSFSENPEQRQGHVRKGDQRQGPGDRALRRPRIHHGANGADDAEKLDEGEEPGQHAHVAIRSRLRRRKDISPQRARRAQRMW